MHKDKINELFTIPRGELEIAGSFYGDKVYTSDKLKKSFIEAVGKSSKGAPLRKKIEELVSRSVLIPVYKSKSIFRSLLKTQPISLQGISGSAIPDLKKIFILIETEANIFSFISNDALASVTVHEMTHLLSILKPNFFYKTFLDDMMKFYSFYFCSLLKCRKEEIKKENLESLCRFIYNVEIGKYNSLNFLREYDGLIKETFKGSSYLSEDEFDATIHDFITSLYTIFKALDSGGSLIPRITVHFKKIYLPLYVTYNKLYGVNLLANHQLAYQELFAPSEIICTFTLAKIIPNKIYQALEKI
jgi:hypothetical protein